jgi:hypothetical protein
MSIPPPNTPPPDGTPPGGYYPAQPPKPSSSGNGWKIAGFGCLGLFLLAAIGGVILVRNVKNSISNPQKNSILGMGIIAGQAGIDGAHLQQAIVAYHTQHGSYPKSLMALYSDGSIDGKLLHNNLDDSPDPAHLSWRYTPPAEGAPGSTPILEEPYHITIGSGTAPGKIIIDLDGKTESNSRTQNSDGSDGGQGNYGGQNSGTQ